MSASPITPRIGTATGSGNGLSGGAFNLGGGYLVADAGSARVGGTSKAPPSLPRPIVPAGASNNIVPFSRLSRPLTESQRSQMTRQFGSSNATLQTNGTMIWATGKAGQGKLYLQLAPNVDVHELADQMMRQSGAAFEINPPADKKIFGNYTQGDWRAFHKEWADYQDRSSSPGIGSNRIPPNYTRAEEKFERALIDQLNQSEPKGRSNPTSSNAPSPINYPREQQAPAGSAIARSKGAATILYNGDIARMGTKDPVVQTLSKLATIDLARLSANGPGPYAMPGGNSATVAPMPGTSDVYKIVINPNGGEATTYGMKVGKNGKAEVAQLPENIAKRIAPKAKAAPKKPPITAGITPMVTRPAKPQPKAIPPYVAPVQVQPQSQPQPQPPVRPQPAAARVLRNPEIAKLSDTNPIVKALKEISGKDLRPLVGQGAYATQSGGRVAFDKVSPDVVKVTLNHGGDRQSYNVKLNGTGKPDPQQLPENIAAGVKPTKGVKATKTTKAPKTPSAKIIAYPAPSTVSPKALAPGPSLPAVLPKPTKPPANAPEPTGIAPGRHLDPKTSEQITDPKRYQEAQFEKALERYQQSVVEQYRKGGITREQALAACDGDPGVKARLDQIDAMRLPLHGKGGVASGKYDVDAIVKTVKGALKAQGWPQRTSGFNEVAEALAKNHGVGELRGAKAAIDQALTQQPNKTPAEQIKHNEMQQTSALLDSALKAKGFRVSVVDSGMGGVMAFSTVEKPIQAAFGNKVQFSVFGDHGSGTYGERTLAALPGIVNNLLKVADRLNPDILLVACNTACTQLGSGALEGIKTPRKDIVNIVELTSKYIAESTANPNDQHPAVLATQATVSTGAYQTGVNEARGDTKITVQQTPALTLARLVNQGADNDPARAPEVKAAVYGYLSTLKKETTSLWLACTHYPRLEKFVKDALSQLKGEGKLDNDVKVIDPMVRVGEHVTQLLQAKRDAGELGKGLSNVPVVVVTSGDSQVHRVRDIVGPILGQPDLRVLHTTPFGDETHLDLVKQALDTPRVGPPSTGQGTGGSRPTPSTPTGGVSGGTPNLQIGLGGKPSASANSSSTRAQAQDTLNITENRGWSMASTPEMRDLVKRFPGLSNVLKQVVTRAVDGGRNTPLNEPPTLHFDDTIQRIDPARQGVTSANVKLIGSGNQSTALEVSARNKSTGQTAIFVLKVQQTPKKGVKNIAVVPYVNSMKAIRMLEADPAVSKFMKDHKIEFNKNWFALQKNDLQGQRPAGWKEDAQVTVFQDKDQMERSVKSLFTGDMTDTESDQLDADWDGISGQTDDNIINRFVAIANEALKRFSAEIGADLKIDDAGRNNIFKTKDGRYVIIDPFMQRDKPSQLK
jgi:glutamate racemase